MVIILFFFAPLAPLPPSRPPLPGVLQADRTKQPGLYAATGGRDKLIKLWDTATGQLIRTLVSWTQFYRAKPLLYASVKKI